MPNIPFATIRDALVGSKVAAAFPRFLNTKIYRIVLLTMFLVRVSPALKDLMRSSTFCCKLSVFKLSKSTPLRRMFSFSTFLVRLPSTWGPFNDFIARSKQDSRVGLVAFSSGSKTRVNTAALLLLFKRRCIIRAIFLRTLILDSMHTSDLVREALGFRKTFRTYILLFFSVNRALSRRY